MADVSDKELRSRIKGILKGADLTTLSAKKVRIQLQESLGTDLSQRRKEIDKMTMALIVEADQGDDGDDGGTSLDDGGTSLDDQETAENDKPAEQSDKSNDEEEEEPPKKKPKVKEKKKHKKHSEPKNRDMAALDRDDLNDIDEEGKVIKLSDEELAQRLQSFEEVGRRTRGRAVKKMPAPKKDKSERKKKEGGSSTYTRPCLLAPDLAKLMGKDKMARNEVVKRMWEIVRERKLEDPKDRRFMLCDDELKNLFGKKRVQIFGMMKNLKHYIKDEKDVAFPRGELLLDDQDLFDDEADDD